MLDRRGAIVSIGGGLALPAVSGLASSQIAAAQETKTRVLPLEFKSEGISLSGGLYLPPGTPAGALVLVHGAGRTPRLEGIARVLAQYGFAVLAYDKRGLGKSEGTYEEAQNTSPVNLDLLARDAAGAMRTLRHHPVAAKLKIGYWGISQAGWIVPLALAKFELADFFVLWAGPVCTVTGNGGGHWYRREHHRR